MKHLIHLGTSIIFALTLLIVDEPGYDISIDAGFVFFFIVFVVFFFGGQYIISRVLVLYKEIYRSWHSVVVGLPLGLLMYYATIAIVFLTRKYIG